MDLAAFLSGRSARVTETITWPGGLELRVAAYLDTAMPPRADVTSVRCIVLNAGTVLVMRDPGGSHILPGGRRERGEALEATLRRELMEEAGCTVQMPRLLGWLHYHHLSSRPEGYAYPYPDFAQLVYWAEVADFLPDLRQRDDVELDAAFAPLSGVRSLGLAGWQLLFLNAALDARSRAAPAVLQRS